MPGLGTQARPRAHHYQFAHQFLTAHFFSDVENCTKLLQMDGALFLHFLWTTTGEELNEKERMPYELKFERRKEGKFDIYLITMPPPSETTEAFYLLLASEGRKQFYYTLELGRTCDGEAKTFVHNAWKANGEQKNHGQLGSSDIEVFVRKCIKLMK